MYLKKAKTIVIKIGSSLLINEQKKIRNKWLIEFVRDIENLLKEKKNVVIVIGMNIHINMFLKISNAVFYTIHNFPK